MLTPCPKTPNCVSSVDTDRRHFVHPLRFSGKIEDARKNLLSILSKSKKARIVKVDDIFIHAEFTSRVFRFVDDVEFYIDDNSKLIHVKSASRVGFSDLGVNRRRVENIRKQFDRGQTACR
jgi:uncharacterized protein (DUF1499 family)